MICLEIRTLPPRKIWHYRKADWEQMKSKVAEQSWDFLKQGTIDEMLQSFNNFILDLMEKYVPHSCKTKVKGTLPWLTQTCVSAIASKHAAEGTPTYSTRAAECQQVLRDEHQKHLTKVKADMDKLPRGSKQWWSLAQQLLLRASVSESIFHEKKIQTST